MKESLWHATHPQITTVRTILLGMVLMISLMVGLLSVQVFSRADDRATPKCDAEPVLASLYDLLGDVALSIRDIHRVAVDGREGHQICYASIGAHGDAQRIKYALYRHSAEHILRMEVVIDD
ncbi:MAG: hypothetical protein CVV10_07445 [Gammaproteobacteria bacterium HGW-Gammaproteobacteria-14]|nr:MAG: hypothetical protein CVV10_07445 [Gammaproteobacteria bacterium HGW-Gammaproteobacteria-14]